eukprot:gnl/TRDRNA2_/TRDRNA2_177771_c0_seq2.p1 gnl/TRDRNA2_/TRDRNA2_177771_c0~~gnl/TRDRNA2_/TRDRNA2_177771_c0_seq2.p1  ORF type:complete len:277 (-),score=-32.80 gnl/TRDRNA2_/TRDRNA2_177771_c0_seq2:111-941(-)
MTVEKCQRLESDFRKYISHTHSLRRVYMALKGVYLQAEVMGKKLTWIMMFQKNQVILDDFDFPNMALSLNFYLEILASVNLRLYHDAGLHYPLTHCDEIDPLDYNVPLMTKNESNETSLTSNGKPYFSTNRYNNSLKSDGASTITNFDTNYHIENKWKISPSLSSACHAGVYGKLFHALSFHISRELPRDLLNFIISSFGGKVFYDIPTHHNTKSSTASIYYVVERYPETFDSERIYVLPQWIFDSINQTNILPIKAFSHNKTPLYHTQPFINKTK